jgi:hypothetical protein
VTTSNTTWPKPEIWQTWNVFNRFQIKIACTKFHENPFTSSQVVFIRSDEEILLDTPLGCEQAHKEKKTTNFCVDKAAGS